MSFAAVAAACGYASAIETEGVEDIAAWLEAPVLGGPRFARLFTRTGTLDDLPRPSVAPIDVGTRFMKHFSPQQGVV